MATLRNVDILSSYPHTECGLTEECSSLGQANACFSNTHGRKKQLGNMAWVPLMQYLSGCMGCLKQQLSESAQPCSPALKFTHYLRGFVCATFLKEAEALVQNGLGAGGKRAAEMALRTQGELTQKAADTGKTYAYLGNVIYSLLIALF